MHQHLANSQAAALRAATELASPRRLGAGHDDPLLVHPQAARLPARACRGGDAGPGRVLSRRPCLPRPRSRFQCASLQLAAMMRCTPAALTSPDVPSCSAAADLALCASCLCLYELPAALPMCVSKPSSNSTKAEIDSSSKQEHTLLLDRASQPLRASADKFWHAQASTHQPAASTRRAWLAREAEDARPTARRWTRTATCVARPPTSR